jgi:hypothetical protein
MASTSAAATGKRAAAVAEELAGAIKTQFFSAQKSFLGAAFGRYGIISSEQRKKIQFSVQNQPLCLSSLIPRPGGMFI